VVEKLNTLMSIMLLTIEVVVECKVVVKTAIAVAVTVVNNAVVLVMVISHHASMESFNVLRSFFPISNPFYLTLL
jgi:hypothetical protein